MNHLNSIGQNSRPQCPAWVARPGAGELCRGGGVQSLYKGHLRPVSEATYKGHLHLPYPENMQGSVQWQVSFTPPPVHPGPSAPCKSECLLTAQGSVSADVHLYLYLMYTCSTAPHSPAPILCSTECHCGPLWPQRRRLDLPLDRKLFTCWHVIHKFRANYIWK